MADNRERPWTIRRLLNWTAEYFERKEVDSPRLAAEMLLAHVLEMPRIKLYMDMDRPATPLERAAYRDLVERAAKHEPVQYLVEQANFFSMDFEITTDVLIPRPSTETLVEHVIQYARQRPGLAAPHIAELGTGSGIIAVALVRHLPDAAVTATDINPAALELAKRNAERHGVTDRVSFKHGSLFEPLEGQRFAFVCANPPYISDAEWERVAPNVKEYEPAEALRAGADGLEVIRPIIAEAPGYLQKPGQLVCEIAASQGEVVVEVARETEGLGNAYVLADAEGLPRVLVADRV